ncbi:stage II sporulation protein R [Anaerosalibacter bizertensis]|uniref:stage II sporulation protein R n=1 Tax=Anaerosalibacter bizertensis TaxID=932217 RepID=UPI0035167EDE
MKYKKPILICSLITVLIIYIIVPFISLEKEETTFQENDNIIRFHVIANSDSTPDQELKLEVRDRILEEVGGEFDSSKNIDESRKIIEENLNKIKNIAEDQIKKEGKDYKVEVSLGNDKFPTKTYGDLTLPAGEYEALKVVIGEGKGKNWWCVMFPPLCFVDITHSVSSVDEEEFKEEINKQENEEETEKEVKEKEEEYLEEEIKEENEEKTENVIVEKEEEEEQEIVLKSKVAELFEKTKTQMAKMFVIE